MGIAFFLQNARRWQARFLASGFELLALDSFDGCDGLLAIDDATAENACMRYIPGSHHLGHLTYTLSENDESNVLNQTIVGAENLGDPVNVELKAGEMSIHSDLLLHGYEANQSTKRRCGLTLRYCPAVVRAGLGWNAKGVVVSGKHNSGHWANPPRPQTDWRLIGDLYLRLRVVGRERLQRGQNGSEDPFRAGLCPVPRQNCIRLQIVDVVVGLLSR